MENHGPSTAVGFAFGFAGFFVELFSDTSCLMVVAIYGEVSCINNHRSYLMGGSKCQTRVVGVVVGMCGGRGGLTDLV